jgi:uncharacterized DUF497 family protein
MTSRGKHAVRKTPRGDLSAAGISILVYRKHGINFDDAKHIFDGPVLEKTDRRRDYGEERIAAVGVTMGLELYVVYTIRGGNCRIISAPRANRHEREAYRLANTQ